MIPITELVNTVRELAQEYPTSSGRAVYFEDGAPVCIIGHAFHRLDVTVPEHRNDRGIHALPLGDMGFSHVFGPMVKWLGLVQQYADSGMRWDLSVEQATKDFPIISKAA